MFLLGPALLCAYELKREERGVENSFVRRPITCIPANQNQCCFQFSSLGQGFVFSEV